MRLCSDLPLSEARRAYARHNGEWRLELAPPPVARLEYELEVVDHDGDAALVCDPGNPHRAPGAFGEKSVLLLPGYAPPRWLAGEGVPGRTQELTPAARARRGGPRRASGAPRTPVPVSRCRCSSRTTAPSTTGWPG